jgi:hypothetical protein
MPGRSTNHPNDYFALGKQPAKDTEATTFAFFKHADGTGMELDEDIVSEREGGDGPEVGLRYKSMIKFDGALNANARSEVALFGFAGILGRTATTIGVASVAEVPAGLLKFRMVPGASGLPYFTAEQRFTDEIERSTNCKVTTLDVEGEAGRAIKLSFSLLNGGTAYRRDIASSLTPTRESTDPVYFPRGSYAIDGAGNTQITKFKASLKRGVDDGIQTVDLWREDLVELNADYDLDFTLRYEDPTLYRKIKFNGGSQIPITLATGAFMAHMNNAAAATANRREITLNFPLIQYVGAKLNKLDPDGKTVYLDVSAMTIKGATDSVIVDVLTASRVALV